MRILVVDDDPELVDLLPHPANGDDLRIVFRTDVKSALAAARKTGFSAFLIAVTMANFNGVSLIRRLRRLHPQALIIACAGKSKTTSASTSLILALASGADRILYQSISEQDLRAALARPRSATDHNAKLAAMPRRARSTRTAAALKLARQPAKAIA